MQRGRGGRDEFFDFGDPFGSFGGFGGFGGQRSLVSSIFGGRDPFDDPFFTRPFGPSIFGPSMFGPSGFGPSMFGPSGNPFGDSPSTGFLDNQPSQPNKSKGPVIEEITSSDDEGEEEGKGAKEKKDNPRKHSRSSNEPYVQDPDDEAEERKSKHLQYRNEYNRADIMQPQTQNRNEYNRADIMQPRSQYRNEYNRADIMQPQTRSFSFQSSSVTYGGANGAYYTSATTRRMGSDGVTLEEHKEADTTTGKAAHRIAKGIRDKGHAVTRKLNPDGKVDTMQTLHNLNEDELPSFEETWKGNARKHLPGWNESLDGHGNMWPSSSGQNGQAARGGWALPSTGGVQNLERIGSDRANSSKGSPFPRQLPE